MKALINNPLIQCGSNSKTYRFFPLITLLSLLCFIIAGCAATGSKPIKTGSLNSPDIICIKTGFTNAFLIPGSKGYLLIDTGYADNYDDFLEQLQRHKINVKEISCILLTHHHDDHAGFAAQIAADSNAVIIAHKTCVERLKKGKNDPAMEPLNTCVAIMVSGFKLFHDDHYPPVELNSRGITISGDNAEVLKQLGFPGRIITTPGHTAGSISVILDNGNAFIGDAAMDLLGICGCRHRPIVVEDRQEVEESLIKIKKSGAKRLFPAHGDPFSIDDLDVDQDQ